MEKNNKKEKRLQNYLQFEIFPRLILKTFKSIEKIFVISFFISEKKLIIIKIKQ